MFLNVFRASALVILVSGFSFSALAENVQPQELSCAVSMADDFEKVVTEFLKLPIEQAIDAREKDFPNQTISAIAKDEAAAPKRIYVLLKPRSAESDQNVSFAYGRRIPTGAYQPDGFLQDKIFWFKITFNRDAGSFLDQIVVRNGIVYLGEITAAKNLKIHVVDGAGTQDVSVVKSPEQGAVPVGFDVSADGKTVLAIFSGGKEVEHTLAGTVAPLNHSASKVENEDSWYANLRNRFQRK